MRHVEIVSPKTAIVTDVPIPEPSTSEVRIRIHRCGICGSDLHAFKGKHPFIDLPATPGHEMAGVIDSVGSDVSGWKAGDRVCVQPQLVCGECALCESGRYNICANLRVMGCQGAGGLAEYLVSPASMLHRLPDDVTFEQGALVEPLAVGVRAVRRAGCVGGRKVLVQGAGTIGLACLMVAKAYGAGWVVLTDIREDRRRRAEAVGADVVMKPEDIDDASWVRDHLGDLGFDVVIECVGIEATVRQAVYRVRKGGRIIIAGVFEEDVSVPMRLIQDREIEIQGTLMYVRDEFAEALRLIAERQVCAEKLVTHRMSLEDVPSAFNLLSDPEVPSGKVIVDCK